MIDFDEIEIQLADYWFYIEIVFIVIALICLAALAAVGFATFMLGCIVYDCFG